MASFVGPGCSHPGPSTPCGSCSSPASRYEPLDWGLGVERNFAKPGHWAGALLSAESYGHFGGAGTFLWVDPTIDLACVCLTDREFGPWAMDAWPPLGDALVSDAMR